MTDPELQDWLPAQWQLLESGAYDGIVEAPPFPAQAADGNYLLTFRDTVPLEDEDGVIRPEWACGPAIFSRFSPRRIQPS